jgi:hypothetical protein|tara:strand:- start:709 stop:930 length:222 start_codon:yes stop_codon:yes gene_type:complete
VDIDQNPIGMRHKGLNPVTVTTEDQSLVVYCFNAKLDLLRQARDSLGFSLFQDVIDRFNVNNDEDLLKMIVKM